MKVKFYTKCKCFVSQKYLILQHLGEGHTFRKNSKFSIVPPSGIST